jgi:transposase
MLLRMTAGRGGQSRLTLDQETNLSAWLEGRFCRSAGEIRAFITAKFELGYSH